MCKKNYYDKGIKLFWLDSAEPIYNNDHIDNLRYYNGPALPGVQYVSAQFRQSLL